MKTREMKYRDVIKEVGREKENARKYIRKEKKGE